MDKEQKAFVLYLNYWSILKDLSYEDLGKLFNAIFEYLNGNEVELSTHLKLAFGFIKNQLDIDIKKYEEKCDKARNAAHKRWNANASERMQTHANAQNAMHKDKDKDKDKKNIFIIPTIEEIQNYCLERKNNIDAQRFFNYYESNGWMVGKNHMKDWKASIRTWEQNSQKLNNKEQRKDETEYVWNPNL